MVKLSQITLPYYKFSKKELKELKETFMPDWQDATDYEHWNQPPNIIQSPDGRIYRLEDCLTIVAQPLVIGNKKQIRALKALDFFNYLYQVDHKID